MVLNTERLMLRKWTEADAESLFEYAKVPDVGPIAGWPPHKNKDESLNVIKMFLMGLNVMQLVKKAIKRLLEQLN